MNLLIFANQAQSTSKLLSMKPNSLALIESGGDDFSGFAVLTRGIFLGDEVL